MEEIDDSEQEDDPPSDQESNRGEKRNRREVYDAIAQEIEKETEKRLQHSPYKIFAEYNIPSPEVSLTLRNSDQHYILWAITQNNPDNFSYEFQFRLLISHVYRLK